VQFTVKITAEAITTGRYDGPMSADSSRVPLPLSVVLERIGLSSETVPAARSLGQARGGRELVQSFTPLSASLEWQLADLHWNREGIFPFIEGGVPYLVNNTGSLSADVAAVLFANCGETPSTDPIRILELGAGTGLFARYLLDELKRRCEEESRDYYDRLTYWITDRSPKTVEQWRERDIFGPHAAHVETRVSDANTAHDVLAERVRAVIANYVLDLLPSAVVRQREGVWEQLHVRTWITSDAGLLRQYTTLTFDEIRALAQSTEPEDVGQLLALLPLLESEEGFFLMDPDDVGGLDTVAAAARGNSVLYNRAALQCVTTLLPRLERDGFIVIHDYEAGPFDDGRTSSAAQRFGPAIGVGLNFHALEQHAHAAGFESLKPSGDDRLRTHPRLILRGNLRDTRQTFEARFAASARDQAAALIDEARRQADAGWLAEALTSYRAALERSPNDWPLMGEAAILAIQLRDHATALELARTALALNPWYAASLWNVLGDALLGLGHDPEAHECYAQASRIHPLDVQTNLRLAGSWLTRRDPTRSLEAVAVGLAHDSDGMFRHLLLDKQRQALDYLSVQWNVERQAAARKRG
jgi:tetratricopeptide (TPR) repeat protein